MKNKFMLTGVLVGSLAFGASVSAEDYVIKKGDTLSEIAIEHNIGLNTIISLNSNIENPNLIFPNQRVNLGGKTSSNHSISTNKVSTTNTYSNNNVDLLARLIQAEAGGESYTGQVAVGAVVLNRVQSDRFPDSIHSVIYQPGQFGVVDNGAINKASTNSSRRAAIDALEGADPTDGALFFYNPTIDGGWLDTRPIIATIGQHTFAK